MKKQLAYLAPNQGGQKVVFLASDELLTPPAGESTGEGNKTWAGQLLQSIGQIPIAIFNTITGSLANATAITGNLATGGIAGVSGGALEIQAQQLAQQQAEQQLLLNAGAQGKDLESQKQLTYIIVAFAFIALATLTVIYITKKKNRK